MDVTQLRIRVGNLIVLCLIIICPVTLPLLFYTQDGKSDLGVEYIGIDGKKTVMLEPEKWIGKDFPLWNYIEQNNTKDHVIIGEWKIILYQHQCEKCMQKIEKFANNQEKNVFCIEIPPYSFPVQPDFPFDMIFAALPTTILQSASRQKGSL